MATRRPRVPKTTQRQLAGVGAGSSAHPVGGHSAKVIPLDAAPSYHEQEQPTAAPPVREPEVHRTRQAAAAETTGRTPNSTTTSTATSTSISRPDAGPAAGADGDGSPVTPEAPAALTPEQRRAEARKALLRRSTPRLRRKPARRDLPRTEARPPVAVEPVPARNFTGRSVAFLVVLFVAAVLLAPTLRVFLDQQAELRAVQEDIAAGQQLEQELTNEIARWEDPAYIKQQARERFNLVMPGERTYMVVGGEEGVEDPVPAPASPSEVNPDLPWADALWDSVVRAGTD